MKKNGFTIYELVISFGLAFAILLVIFNTSISLNKRLSSLYVKNGVSSKQIILNKKIGMDFNSKVITSATPNNNNVCEITFEDGKTIKLEISNEKDNKFVSITHNSSTEKITFDNNVNIDTNMICEKNHIKVPITHSDDKIDYGIDLYNFIS